MASAHGGSLERFPRSLTACCRRHQPNRCTARAGSGVVTRRARRPGPAATTGSRPWSSRESRATAAAPGNALTAESFERYCSRRERRRACTELRRRRQARVRSGDCCHPACGSVFRIGAGLEAAFQKCLRPSACSRHRMRGPRPGIQQFLRDQVPVHHGLTATVPVVAHRFALRLHCDRHGDRPFRAGRAPIVATAAWAPY